MTEKRYTNLVSPAQPSDADIHRAHKAAAEAANPIIRGAELAANLTESSVIHGMFNRVANRMSAQTSPEALMGYIDAFEQIIRALGSEDNITIGGSDGRRKNVQDEWLRVTDTYLSTFCQSLGLFNPRERSSPPSRG